MKFPSFGMEPSSPFYPLSPGAGAFGVPPHSSASAFSWDINSVAGRDLVPMPRLANQTAPFPLPILSACSPLPVPTDPLTWSKDDVECWLRWCMKEFALSNLDPKCFSMNGKALCLLPKDSFRHRTRESGDVLFEVLQKLIFYNNYLNRHGNTDESRYNLPTSSLLQQPNNRLSPVPAKHPSVPPTSVFNQAYHPHMYSNKTNGSNEGRQHVNSDNGLVPTHAHEFKEASPYHLGHGVVPTVPLNLKPSETQSSTPCSDSGTSSPGMIEEDHQHPQHIGHPLSRHVETNSYRLRHGHRYSPIEHDSQYRETVTSGKRHRSVGDIEECSNPKRLASLEEMRMDSRTQYLMQQRMAAIHGARHHNNPESHQRLLERESQYLFHHHPEAMARQHPHHEDAHSRLPPTYPIPNGLPFLDAGRHRGMYYGGEVPAGMYHEEGEDPAEDDIFASGEKASDCRLLWEFLSQLLKQEKYAPYIKWEDEEKRVFRIQDPTAIANLWGRQKNRTNMTYEKLSRALRYYYKTGIIQKEPGQKLTYRFLQDPKDIASMQRFSKGNKAKPTNDSSQSQQQDSDTSPEDRQSNSPLSSQSNEDNTTPVSESNSQNINEDNAYSEDHITQNIRMERREEPHFSRSDTCAHNDHTHDTSIIQRCRPNDDESYVERFHEKSDLDNTPMVIKQEPCILVV